MPWSAALPVVRDKFQVAPAFTLRMRALSNPPSVPTNVIVSAGNGQLGVAWDAMPNADSYNVYVTPPGGTYSVVTNSKLVTGLTNGTTYTVQVTSVNGSGESAKSPPVTATPSAPSITSSGDIVGSAGSVGHSVVNG